MRVVEGGTRPEAVRAAFALVRAQLAGAPLTLEPRDPRAADAASSPAHVSAPRVAVVLSTSGSGGQPRRTALRSEALRWHARAVQERLGGPGRWLLALPLHHVAGWQVLVRAALAGSTPPVVLDTTAGFDAGRLAAAVADVDDAGPRCTSLVPTQLVRALAHPAARDALARLDVVLVGGAAAPAGLLERARAAGIRVVETYGMTETGGGCVYDGVPLDGVRVAVRDGRLEVAGPTLAAGYVGADGTLLDEGGDSPFLVRDGVRWVRTADLGSIGEDGRVRVHGRADDVIVTGGVKVHPAAVERVLQAAESVADVVVVGLPDAEWGSCVTAVVVSAPGSPAPDLAELRERVAGELGRAHAPRALAVVPSLPLLGPGKVDRPGAARLAAAILAGRQTLET